MRKRAATSGCAHTHIYDYVCTYAPIHIYIYKVGKHGDVYAYGGTVNILAVSTVQPPNMYLRNKYLFNNVATQQDEEMVNGEEGVL